MNMSEFADRYIEQTWENLPNNLGVMSAGENIDRLAKVLFEELTDDEVVELRDRLLALLEGE